MMLVNYKTRVTHLVELLLLSILLVVFSWFIRDQWPIRLISFFALLAISWIISDHYQFLKDLVYQLKHDFLSRKMVIFNLIGLQLGIAVALYFRFSSQMYVLPQSFNWFLIAGIAIAIMEECMFRGIVQSTAEKMHYQTAPLVAALIHSAYKVTIFIPLANSNPNVNSLFIGSFIAFVGLGYLKQFTGSIVPAIIAHVVFDIIVYAEYAHAPWWVW
jgi:membrane protease YdiL (CAAX protease family)